MWKSIFIYFLFALIYLGFSTIPVTEVSAQNTIAITSGNNQSTTRGQNFPNAVTFTVTNGGTPVNNETVSIGVSNQTPGVKISATASGTFTDSISLSTNSSGEVTIHVKANTDSYYETCQVAAFILVGTTAVTARFTGTITDVLYFPAATATRSVVEGTAANSNIGAAVSATHWTHTKNDVENATLAYSFNGGTDDGFFNIGSSTGQLTAKAALTRSAGSTYSVKVKVEEKDPSDNSVVRSDDEIDVTITVTNAPVFTEGTSTTRSVAENTPPGQNIGAPVAATDADTGDTLTYTLGGTDAASFRINSTNGQLRTSAPLDYERRSSYSVTVSVSDGTGGSDSITVTINVTDVADEPTTPPQTPPQSDTPAEDTTNQSPPENTPPPVDTNIETEQTPQQRRIRYECPVGWTRGSIFGNTKKALIYELKVNVDLTNTISIYQLKSLAIYVHPEENLETLEGWYLTTGILYNHDHENKFQLTAENAVIDEHGFAHIQNPEATAIRMGTLGFIGQSLPSFDYRLYDERGARVDFGISCYKEGGLTFRLWNTEDPRVLRVLPFPISDADLSVRMKELDWQTPFFRTQWTAAIMPDLPDAPAAPSLIKKNIVGTWADLKKQ